MPGRVQHSCVDMLCGSSHTGQAACSAALAGHWAPFRQLLNRRPSQQNAAQDARPVHSPSLGPDQASLVSASSQGVKQCIISRGRSA